MRIKISFFSVNTSKTEYPKCNKSGNIYDFWWNPSLTFTVSILRRNISNITNVQKWTLRNCYAKNISKSKVIIHAPSICYSFCICFVKRLVITCFPVLRSYIYVSISAVEVLTVRLLIHFVKPNSISLDSLTDWNLSLFSDRQQTDLRSKCAVQCS